MHNTELRFPFSGKTSEAFSSMMQETCTGVWAISASGSSQQNIEDFNYMVHAVGFGIRYRTPVGPVRVDLAWSINGPRFNGLKGTREQLLDPNAFRPDCASLPIGCVEFVEQRISRFQFHFSLGQLF